MTKRVAIQLYGHLRSFEKTYKSLFKNIIDCNKGIEFDIFIHTWDELDSIQEMPHYEKKVNFSDVKITDKSVLEQIYKPKKIIIEKQIELTDTELQTVYSNNYDVKLAKVFRNVCHTFCGVNRLRKEYENETGTKYDLILTTRPDILFYSPLYLHNIFDRGGGFQFYEEADMENHIFSTYINGVHSVINQEKYIAGLDLLFFARPSVCDKLMTWEDDIDNMLNLWAEYAIINRMNIYGIKHSYFVYEKDKCWTILRCWQSVDTNKFVEIIYKYMVCILLKCRTYCRHTYLNVTTYKDEDDFKEYLIKQLGFNPFSLFSRLFRRLLTAFVPSKKLRRKIRGDY